MISVSRRILAILVTAVLGVVAGSAPAQAHSRHLKTSIDLPAGFQPEGIAPPGWTATSTGPA
jgi:hypothetical protein